LKEIKNKIHLKLICDRYSGEIRRQDPIIVLGMHRSGTTMLGELLGKLGVFLGHECDAHGESKFIMACNENVLHFSHSAWDDPRNLEYLYEYPERVSKFTDKLKKSVISRDFIHSYVGTDNASDFFQCKKPWGWKEPRTTVLWPIWKGVFPQAKFIFLYRNGIDVAQSLRRRAESHITIVDKSFSSPRCMELNRAFKVWEEYNELYVALKERYTDADIFEVCYENLLRDPIVELQKIIKYLELNADTDLVEEVAAKVNSTKAYSFIDDKELKDFYEVTRNNPMMKKFGYDNLTS